MHIAECYYANQTFNKSLFELDLKDEFTNKNIFPSNTNSACLNSFIEFWTKTTSLAHEVELFSLNKDESFTLNNREIY